MKSLSTSQSFPPSPSVSRSRSNSRRSRKKKEYDYKSEKTEIIPIDSNNSSKRYHSKSLLLLESKRSDDCRDYRHNTRRDSSRDDSRDNRHHNRRDYNYHRDNNRDRSDGRRNDSREDSRNNDRYSRRHNNDMNHYNNSNSERDFTTIEKVPEDPPSNIIKEKANFGLSGALAKDEVTGNMVNGIVLKYSPPLDAMMPNVRWRLYVFKGDEIIETLFIHRKMHYLFGRDDRVADIITLHESCSKQHAVIQFREVKSNNEKVIKPYLIDLGSQHKTFLNGNSIEDSRYYELRGKDAIRFGASSREYILLHDSSK